ncbi:DUF1127 domain-containing protein [Lichenihabitans sp. Uapishka_5]|uniref:DUF1127 domain-containing protein n=1 Tax=Lichenihabitans sp. Uapishka_5 TaxID=3037302 RepID=UPI0029E7CD49|nr:DUF1127 domain-containing protein [Lichenihabitans sp. Uapishka_5]MDX7951030.1 DUF1127 domain-containing protein [Lichenihabitans sp. Uapishka_5]
MSRPAVMGPVILSAAPLLAAVRALGVALLRRRVLGQIGAMNDHMLRDIGLTRQDVWSVAADPLFRDPTLGLAARADATRQRAWTTARKGAAQAELRRRWDAERHAA